MFVTAAADDVRTLMNLLTSLEGVEHVEEVADEMPHMDDADLSSADLPDDMGPGTHQIEAQTGNAHTAQKVRDTAMLAARQFDCVLEFDDEGE
jgi:citrate lyase beta subunit